MFPKYASLISLFVVLPACPAAVPVEASDTEMSGPATGGETDGAATQGTGETDPTSGPEGTDETGTTEETDDPSLDTTGTGAEESLSFEEYIAAFNANACADSVTCGLLPSTDFCDTTELGFAEDRVAFDAGEISFDGVAAAECIAVWAAQEPSCTSGRAELTPQQELDETERRAACEGILTGTVRRGGDCVSINSCAGGPEAVYCDGLSTAQCTPGTCTAAPEPQGQAQPCELLLPFGEPCEAGLYCRQAEPGNFEQGICDSIAAAGGECFGDSGCEQGTFCAEGEDIGAAGMCVLVGETDGACVPRPFNARTSCASTSDFCHADGMTCQAKLELGAPCDDASECVDYGYCSSGTCVMSGDEGEVCAPGEPGACVGYLGCDSDSGVCERFEFPACE